MRCAVLVALAACCSVACKPSTPSRPARDVRVVLTEPRCRKIGVLEGVVGSERHARQNALELASERGATHVRLDQAHPDLEDGLTFVVATTMIVCPSSEQQFPPDGYP